MCCLCVICIYKCDYGTGTLKNMQVTRCVHTKYMSAVLLRVLMYENSSYLKKKDSCEYISTLSNRLAVSSKKWYHLKSHIHIQIWVCRSVDTCRLSSLSWNNTTFLPIVFVTPTINHEQFNYIEPHYLYLLMVIPF